MDEIKTTGVGEIPCIGNEQPSCMDEQPFVLEFKVKRNKMVLVFLGVATESLVVLAVHSRSCPHK